MLDPIRIRLEACLAHTHTHTHTCTHAHTHAHTHKTTTTTTTTKGEKQQQQNSINTYTHTKNKNTALVISCCSVSSLYNQSSNKVIITFHCTNRKHFTEQQTGWNWVSEHALHFSPFCWKAREIVKKKQNKQQQK